MPKAEIENPKSKIVNQDGRRHEAGANGQFNTGLGDGALLLVRALPM
jgi:hypothetical protein